MAESASPTDDPRFQMPFAGMKVIDMSGGVAGPTIGVMLAQYGADVIKIENPGNGGDWGRLLGQNHGGHTSFSIYSSLGKRSVALDIKSDAGRAVLWRLLEGADVLIEGFRPGTMTRLGLGYEAVAERVPRIVYCSMSGFGPTGPMANLPAMDPVLQAFVGIMDENRGQRDGHPHRFELSAIDLYSGMTAFQTVAISLLLRDQVGTGRHVQFSLLQGAAMLSTIRMIGSYFDGPLKSFTPGGVYDTADGQINLTTIRASEWTTLCEAIGHPELLSDPRFATAEARRENRDLMLETMRSIFREHTTAWHVERLTKRGIMNSRVNTYSEFLQERQVADTGLISWLDIPGFEKPVPVPNFPGLPPLESDPKRGASPLCGVDTAAVLRDHGYGSGEIDALLRAGVIGGAP